MGILLLIGKAIVTIIAYLLLILLVLLLLVLFVPITYSAKASRYEEIIAEGNIGWLFNLFMIKIIYNEHEEYYLKIAGIKVFSSNNTDEKDEDKRAYKELADIKSEKKKDIKIELKQQEREAQYSKREKQEEQEIQEKQEKIDKIKKSGKKKANKNFFKNKKGNEKKNKNRFKKNKAKEEKTGIIDRLKQIKEFFDKEEYKGVVGFVIFHIKKIIKSILPKRIKAKLVFGTEDPALTGYILGGASLLYAFTKSSLTITPDFEESKIEGDVDFKGRIIIAVIVYHGLRVILDKRVRRLIKEYT